MKNIETVLLLSLMVNPLMLVARPNIIFILTDDQDIALSGLYPMKKTIELIGSAGIIFINAFTSTPICCPSRATILTGTYLHNHRTVNNSINGNCSSEAWQSGPEKKAFVTDLKRLNYTTFFAGKYLNQYGMKATGGVEHIPPGWDQWIGLVGNSKYYNYTLSLNGKWQHHGDDPQQDYFTNVINRHATDFLKDFEPSKGPLFMMLSTPASHTPFTPEPKYSSNFSDLVAPRTKNFNVSNPTKHWLLRQTHGINGDVADFIDDIFRNRWRTLLSVDDMVENVIKILEGKQMLNNTYVFFASDNGFHLGQFSLPMDKRQLYETDIRIPLMVRGPGIPSGQLSRAVVVTTDFASTFLELAGSRTSAHTDGISFVPVLRKPLRPWRTDFLVEYVGEGKPQPVPGCPHFAQGGVACCGPDCICEDAFNNTYTCLRTLTDQQSTMFCQFEDSEHFIEMYNLHLDPYQMDNLAFDEDHMLVMKSKETILNHLRNCKGRECIIMDYSH